MKIKNNSAAFEIKYDNVDYEIINGEMEINNDAFGTFVLAKAREWGLDVVKTEQTVSEAIKPVVEAVKAIEEQSEDVDSAELAKEDTTKKEEETKTKKTKK